MFFHVAITIWVAEAVFIAQNFGHPDLGRVESPLRREIALWDIVAGSCFILWLLEILFGG